MSLGLLFPGQGTQHPDMLPWLESEPAAAPLLQALALQLGNDWRTRLSESAWATANANAQPLLTAVSLAAWQVLAPRLPPPAVVLGYSVGEIAAFAAAQVFTPIEAVRLATQRAALMDAAGAEQPPTGLLAVQGLLLDELTRRCKAFGLQPALLLEADQTIVGGPRTGLEAAQAALEAAGVRCSPIAVQVASHTAWMSAAVAPLQAALERLNFQRPRCAVIVNAEGDIVLRPAALKEALAVQVARPIPWQRCIDAMAERGVTQVLEVGPGTTLARLWQRRHPTIPVRSLADFQTVDGILRWAGPSA